MQPTRPLPASGSVLVDTRGGGRALRVSWHPENDVVILSLWRDNLCIGSFRLWADEVPALIAALHAGLPADVPADVPAAPSSAAAS